MAIVSKPGGPFRVLDFGQVQVQVQIGDLTDESFEAHLTAETNRLNEYMKVRDALVPRKAVIIVDPSCDLVPKASIRRMQADWIERHRSLLRIVCHGMGLIVPNLVARNVTTAILWLASAPVPIKAHKDLDEAIAWAIAEADSIGGDVDPELRKSGRGIVEKYRRMAQFSPESLDEILRKRTAAKAAIPRTGGSW